MGVDLGVEAWRVKALVALNVGKQGSIESAAARASNASSGGWVKRGVVLIERCLGKLQIKVGLNPRGKVLRG